MTQFASKYPVFHYMNEAKWAWLCDTIGTPQKDWACKKGAIWFKCEQDKMLYLLRWT